MGDHDWRERSDGVRFVKTAKIRRQIAERVTRDIDYELKEKAEKDPEFFERPTEDIANMVIEQMRDGIRKGLRDILNRPE